ncbi:tetratricopeptide repeat protein [Paenarthrobacter sp. NPDC056912]|uniref:tetratricopeptide repeat protein n=1 Tax=Paenarthrobacter sp. NPDC056912 TaxID=3345965 RepID=UPI003673563A
MDKVNKDRIRQMMDADPNAALYALSNAAGTSPQDPDVWFLLGVIQLRFKRFSESLNYFKHASVLKRDDPLTFFYIGLAAERLNKLPEAISAYRTAYRLNPGMTKAREKLKYLTGQDPLMDAPHARPPRSPRGRSPVNAGPKIFVDKPFHHRYKNVPGGGGGQPPWIAQVIVFGLVIIFFLALAIGAVIQMVQ